MKTCTQCQSSFEVTNWDRNFLDRVSPVFAGQKCAIPEPTLCPQCRLQRRMVWRAELHLFKRKSDFSGKPILSQFPPDAPFNVYSVDEWYGDGWDGRDYAREFDFNRPFFEQFEQLLHEAPVMGRSVINNQNCDYVNNAGWNKNCYLVAAANHNEDCFYGNFVNYSKNCLDSSFIDRCELCYECVDCKDCYNLKYSTNCHNASDSYFLYNCRNVRNCFGSVNLVGKEYVFMNQQLTKEAYEKKMEGLQLHRRSRVEEARQFFEKHRLKYPHKAMMGEMNEDVSGNAINQSRRAWNCFDVSKLEDCKYCGWFHESKNCMDIYSWGVTGTEECYFCTEVGNQSYHVLFSVITYNGMNVYYSCNTVQSQDLFGCVGLKSKKFCILNKQYTESQYNDLALKIVDHMKSTGEWGQFLPMRMALFNYNQSIADDYFPLKKDQALTLGARWGQEPPVSPPLQKVDLPDSIADTDASICDLVLTCEKTGRPYKIIPQEFKFYKQNGIPLPAFNWEVRHKNRLARRNPRRLWDRECAKCQAKIQTSYAPDRPEIVFCESCYLKEVY